MNLFRKALLALLLALPQAGGAEECWKLLSQAQVDSAGVFLDQIVDSSAAGRPLPHVRLARAPLPGETAAFTRNEVAGIAEACVPGLIMTNWSGPLEARVSRRLRAFEDADLIELLTSTLQKEYVKNQGELELHLMHAWAKPQVPDEPLSLKIAQMPSTGLCPSFVVGFELWDGKEHLGTWQMPVQASVWRDIPVAQATLARGELLKEADITMQRADILIQRDVFLNYPTVDDTLELTESIAAGRPILSRCIRSRPLVQRGQLVEAVFQDGALGISLMVETLEDGALGQTVRVRNPRTRRELYGKVLNEKTVGITL